VPLAAGQTLAFYEILGPLGSGGMGEVYRARDTRLDREVAIKVLPDELAGDEDRLRRFEREAKVLASLNHPHVAAIHGIDQVGDTCFLALELVEGEDLAQVLARGRMTVREALDAARQIAEGLEAAHEAGVVHRDLKPANVRVTPAGLVKVLDFGLAKPTRVEDSGSTTAKPDSFLVTEDGLVLGTPTYMSPEQARGKAVDRRADVWAFGCVLYECLTGKRAFDGRSFSEIAAAILEREPDWSALPASTPPYVERLLRRCFDKDARTRLRDIGEARVLLERGETDEEPVKTRAGTLVWWLLAAAVVVAVVGWVRGGAQVDEAPSVGRPQPTRFVLEFAADEADVFRDLHDLAVSPDGRSVAVAIERMGDDEGLFVRDLDALEPRLLEGTEGTRDVTYSRDGKWLVVHNGNRDSLERISPAGGRPFIVCKASDSTGLSTDESGRVAFTRGWGTAIDTVPVDGSSESSGETELLIAEGDRTHIDPFFLPGGGLLFTVWTASSWDDARIVAIGPGGDRKTLKDGGTAPKYVPLGADHGALLWVRSGALWGQRLELDGLRPHGDPVLLLEGIRSSLTSGRSLFDVSPTGTLAYVDGGIHAVQNELVFVDRDGREEPVLQGEIGFQSPSLSQDGRRLCVVKEGAVFQVFGVDLTQPLERRILRRLSFEPDAYYARLSRDGERVAYVANADGEYRLYVRPFASAGAPALLHEKELRPLSWHPDGSWLLCHSGRGTSGSDDLVKVPVDPPGEPEPVVATPADEWGGQISPDGRWVAYISNETGQSELYVESLEAVGGKVQVTNGGAWAPRWSRDGTELYYRFRYDQFVVPVTLDPFTAGSPELMFSGPYGVDGSGTSGFVPMEDGRFLMLKKLAPDAELRVVVVENWRTELEEKLPPLETD
jgi:Tol biopolymer transport system component